MKSIIVVGLLSNQSCCDMCMCQVELEKGADALNNDMDHQGIGAVEYLNKLTRDRNFSHSCIRRGRIACDLNIAFRIVQVLDYTS